MNNDRDKVFYGMSNGLFFRGFAIFLVGIFR